MTATTVAGGIAVAATVVGVTAVDATVTTAAADAGANPFTQSNPRDTTV